MSQSALFRGPNVGQRMCRGATAAGLWVALLSPIGLGWQRCPVASLLHYPCPGCGMTRAAELFLRGHVRESLRMHPLVLPALAVLLLLVASTVSAAFDGAPLAAIHRRLLARVAIALAFVVCALACVVWMARALGAFGGPVRVW